MAEAITLHLGLIVNPIAGLGGSRAFKGSDGEALRSLASSLSPEQLQRSAGRVLRALQPLQGIAEKIRFSTWGAQMGADVLAQLGFAHRVLGQPSALSGAQDTRCAAKALRQAGVDLLLFAGGDGTARDLYDVLGSELPVLGIPAGVKMHSGVFAVSPEAAGELLGQLADGGLVGVRLQEVRDIDEAAFRENRLRSQFYGEMPAPGESRFLQHTKVSGRESPELAVADIASWVVEQMCPDTTYLIGPGSTTAAVMTELGLPNTLLGVDVVRAGELLLPDASEQQLLELLQPGVAAKLIVTAIGGQGHVFGRGNQQFSAAVIRTVGLSNLIFIAAKSKLSALAGRPLLVDTNDPALDRELSGYHSVITGYDDRVLYRIA